MTQAIHLDFLGKQQPPKLGWFVLAVGIALVAWQLLQYSQLLQANAALRSELQSVLASQKINKQDLKNQPVPTATERSATAQARAITTQLNLPWESLLSLLETAQHPDVALLALDPKGQNGQIRLTAEAKDASAMMAYIASLQQNQLLQNALLTSHQVQIQQPGTPFRFQILAQWKGRRVSSLANNVIDVTQALASTEKATP